MTIQMDSLETHIGSIERCIELSNGYFWNLVVFEGSDKNGVSRAEGPPSSLRTTAKRLTPSYYGMGMAYAGIPQHLFQQMIRDSKEIFF
jgi:hypothetical protein